MTSGPDRTAAGRGSSHRRIPHSCRVRSSDHLQAVSRTSFQKPTPPPPPPPPSLLHAGRILMTAPSYLQLFQGIWRLPWPGVVSKMNKTSIFEDYDNGRRRAKKKNAIVLKFSRMSRVLLSVHLAASHFQRRDKNTH